jgi:hypothetical protein
MAGLATELLILQSDTQTMNPILKLRHKLSTYVFDVIQSRSVNPFDKLVSGTGVEVGVWRGTHAKALLSNPRINHLSLVDPYLPYNEPVKSALADEAKLIASRKLRKFKDRHDFIYQKSVEASSCFKDGSLDFIYIDGDHSEEAVFADLQAWWPKLRKDGLMGLDDYNPNYPGLMNAAKRFGQPVKDLGGVGLIVK